MMKNKLNILLYFAFTAAFSQQKNNDSSIIKKMIVGTIENNVYVGAKINDKCQMERTEPFYPVYKYMEGVAVVTDYIVCNNGNPNMFFEIYDGEKFKYVKDTDIKFPQDSGQDDPKIILSQRNAEERKFVRSNVDVMINFMKDFGEEEKAQEISAAMDDATDPFLRNKKYGVGLIRFYPVDNNYSTGAFFHVFNSSKKTIKYIWFTAAGENAVGDLVKTNGAIYKTFKGIGPIKTYEDATWTFDDAWLTNIVETLKISSIKIQYMDNTVKTLKYNDEMYIGQEAYDKLNAVRDQNDEFKKGSNK